MKDLRSWVSRRGILEIEVQEGQVAGCVISDGCSVRFLDEDVQFMLASGRGVLEFNIHAPRPGVLVMVPDQEDGLVSAYFRDWGRVVEQPGFHRAPSYAQLEPKTPGAVPKEVRDLIEKSARSALYREAALRAEIERLRQSSAL